MRDTHQEVLFNVAGQSLVHDALEGRASAVTSVTVYEADGDDDVQAEAATSGSGAVETNPSTTFDAASGAGQSDPTRCALTATTGIVRGRVYLATNATGDKEWVPVVAITANDSVQSRVPLLNAYAAADTFQTTRMSIGLSTTWIAAVSNLSEEECTAPRYRVVWVYVVGGVTYRHQTYFDLVRYSARHTVTGIDVDGRFPGWLDMLPIDFRREQGQQVIEEAFRAVRMDLLADGKLGRWVRHLDVVNELVAYRARQMGAENAVLQGGGSLDAVEVARSGYTKRYDQLTREPHVPLSASAGGASLNNARREPFLRR